jgi:hypothetical protein
VLAGLEGLTPTAEIAKATIPPANRLPKKNGKNEYPTLHQDAWGPVPCMQSASSVERISAPAKSPPNDPSQMHTTRCHQRCRGLTANMRVPKAPVMSPVVPRSTSTRTTPSKLEGQKGNHARPNARIPSTPPATNPLSIRMGANTAALRMRSSSNSFMAAAWRRVRGDIQEYLSDHPNTRSAICTAFRAAPFRRLSPQENSSRASGRSGDCLIRPTKTSSRPAASSGLG